MVPHFVFCIYPLSGDGEGGNEMTDSMLLIREFCDRLVNPEKATRTRIVSPHVLEKYQKETNCIVTIVI